ncbi:hypothetical protein, partial [Mailhella sp.]
METISVFAADSKHRTASGRVSASLVPLRASIFHFLTQYTETQKKTSERYPFRRWKEGCSYFLCT